MATIVILASADSLIRVLRENTMLPHGYHTDYVLSSIRSDSVAPFVPILAVLPFATSYVDDIKSKFVRFFLIRTNYTCYLFSRILVCFFCGGLVIVAGVFLAWGTLSLLFIPMERVMEMPSDSTAIVLKTCGLLFLNGGFWAVAGMTMSTMMESKYIAYASPFVMYYMLVIINERYFPDAYLIYPREWLAPSDLWPFGLLGPAILIIELAHIVALLFIFRAGRRLREL